MLIIRIICPILYILYYIIINKSSFQGQIIYFDTHENLVHSGIDLSKFIFKEKDNETMNSEDAFSKNVFSEGIFHLIMNYPLTDKCYVLILIVI